MGVPNQTPTTRDPWLDNAKMLLVTLVVVGHSWVLLPDNDATDHLYDFLYAWHVPAFVFVTGYLSRGFVYSRVRLWQLFRTVVVPYLVFECALALFRIYVGGEQLQVSPLLFLGLLGLAAWLVWLVVTGLRLIRGQG